MRAREFVHALEGIMWMDKGIPHRRQGFRCDINIKRHSYYSDSEAPAKGGLEVEVSLPSLGDRDTNLRMGAQSSIIRVESPRRHEEQHGFATLDRSRK